jgi:hypothetical protein
VCGRLRNSGIEAQARSHVHGSLEVVNRRCGSFGRFCGGQVDSKSIVWVALYPVLALRLEGVSKVLGCPP